MQMLLIICRESFEQKIIELLEDNGVEGYTVIEKVRGAGKTGMVPLTSDWAGLNSLVLVGAPSPQAQSIVTMLKTFSSHHAAGEGGLGIPLKVLTWSCDMVL